MGGGGTVFTHLSEISKYETRNKRFLKVCRCYCFHALTHLFFQGWEVCYIIGLILQLRKLRLKESIGLDQGHSASQGQNQDSNIPESGFWAIVLSCPSL